MGTQKKTLTWVGWVLTGLIGLLMVFSASGKLMKVPEVVEQISKFGYSEDLIQVIGVLEVCSVIIFLIPRTAILGAVLLTGYLGALSRLMFAFTTFPFWAPRFSPRWLGWRCT